MQILTREFLLYQLSWLFGPKNGSNGAINLYKYQFNPQKLGLSTSLTLTETLGNKLEQKKVSSKTRSNGLHYYHQDQLTSSSWNACNAYKFGQEGHLALDDGSASYLTFILIFFFFSMITSSTAHEKSYPTWRGKDIDDFLCVNTNACRNIYVISPVYLLSPLTHIIITLDFLRLALSSYNCKIREHSRGLSRFLVLALRRGIVFCEL